VRHIASHFQFHPGDDTASFLLLGDGSHLPLAQLKIWPQPFQGVELLTLSACNTAVGSPRAEGKEADWQLALSGPHAWPGAEVSADALTAGAAPTQK
jgi:CHAT domain-containing protein